MVSTDGFAVGASRLGWIKFASDEPLPALLARRDSGIVVEVIGDTTAFDVSQPGLEGPNKLRDFDVRSARFIDAQGAVELAGLVPESWRDPWDSRPNSVTFSVGRTVIDGNGRVLDSVVGLRTDHPVLDTWMYVRNVINKYAENGADNHWMKYEMSNATSVPIEEFGPLEIVSYPVAENIGMQGVLLRSRTEICTQSDNGIDLGATLEAHGYISNLLSVLVGDLILAGPQMVAGSGNPITVFGGEALPGNKWCPILFGSEERGLAEAGFHDFLLRYSDCGPSAIANWMQLNAELRDGVDAFLGALPSAGADWEGRLVSIAIAFERIGYSIERQFAVGVRRKGLSFIECVKNVCLDSEELVFRRPEIWADRFRLAYRGIKHADRQRPEPEETAKVVLVAVNVLRLWFIHKIGFLDKVEDHWWKRLHLFCPWFWPGSDQGEGEWWGGEFSERNAGGD